MTFALGLLVAFVPSGVADDAIPDCRPVVDLASIDGRAPEEALAPDGHVSGPSLVLEVLAGLEGPACADLPDHAPMLLGAWASDLLVNEHSSFAYYVVFVDLDNEAPTEIVAHLDGTLARDMYQVDPLDTNYADGVLFSVSFGSQMQDDVVVPDAGKGDHFVVLSARNARAAEPVTVQGPRLVAWGAASVTAPDPANRLFIHPIGNGPTFVPTSEVPPPMSRLTGGPGDGVYSVVVPIEPDAWQMGAEWGVSTGGGIVLRGSGLLEGTPGREAGFDLLGGAAVDARAHVGLQSVDLAPAGATPDAAGVLGGVRAYPEPVFHFAQVGHVRAYYQHVSEAPSLLLRLLVEADLDGDARPDFCAFNDVAAPTTGGQWLKVHLERESPMRLLVAGCSLERTPVDTQDGVTTLNDLENDPTLGLARVLSMRVEALGDAAAAEGTSLLVDSLHLASGDANTNADFDACIYGPVDDLPNSPVQPLVCASDIGPHGGILPPRARFANVWANDMLPYLDFETHMPERPYLEPAAFSFSYRVGQSAGPAFELPAAPVGSLRLVDDQDGDQAADPDEPVLAAIEGLEVLAGVGRFTLTAPFEGADGAEDLVLVYEHGADALGVPESATLALRVQRFVNDEPQAGLAYERHGRPARMVTFFPSAFDADAEQGEVASRLGAITSWSLDFGDNGEPASGVGLPPSSIDHRYRGNRDREATLTLVDAQGAVASARILVDLGRADLTEERDLSGGL